MEKQLKQPSDCEAIYLGETTLRRMIKAVYDKDDPLYSRNTFSECGDAHHRLNNHPDNGDDITYIYYHRKTHVTIMTTVEGDIMGIVGSSAGFEGKLTPEEFDEKNKLLRLNAKIKNTKTNIKKALSKVGC